MPLFKFKKTLFSCAVLFLTSFAAHADNTRAYQPSLWLQQISDSTASQSYQGTFIYRCDAQLVAMRIIHAANDSSGHEKLISLNGPAHEVVQDGQSITSSLFRGKRAMGAGNNKTIFGSFDKVLDAHYEIVEIGEDRIANRHTKVMEIRPKDQYRYGFLIWLDSETGIVLRSDMADETGQIIEQVMFIDVEMLTDNIANNYVGSDSNQQVDNGETQTPPSAILNNKSQWHVSKMPAGFMLSERYLRQGENDSLQQEQLVFSDGLASVSVFIEPYRKIGAVNVYGKLIENHQITIVGDVPKATVEYIAGSVYLQ